MFWVGATVPITARFMVEADIPEVLGNGASAAVLPTLIFSWALSNRLSFKLPNTRACTFLGLLYGAGLVIVFPASLHFLTQQLSGHIQLAHIVNALYTCVVPWWIAKISSRCTRSLPDINQ